MSFLQKIPQN